MAQQGDWIPPPPSTDVLHVLNIDPGPFQFPPQKRPNGNGPGYSSTDQDEKGTSVGRTDSISSEPHITKVDRSHSTPNVHATITKLGAAGFELPETLVPKGNEAMRTKGMVQLDELFGVTSSSSTVQSNAAKSSSIASSPNKSTSRSVSSSPTGTIRQPRARASSADDSATKRIKTVSAAEQKEPIEDWEIPAHDIKLYKKNIGQGSFGTVYRGYWHGNVAVKTLNVKNPSLEQIQAFRNEVALLRKTR